MTELIRFEVFSFLPLLLFGISTASDYETVSYLPLEGIEEFIVERLDITTFRNSIGPARSPGMRHFSDLGLVPTEVSQGKIVFETEDWYYCVEIIERRDVNHDGIEDVQIRFTDDSLNGTYLTDYIYLLTCFAEDSNLIAIAYGPSGDHYGYRDQHMSEGLVVPWSEQYRLETNQ